MSDPLLVQLTCFLTESKASDDEQQFVQQKQDEQHGGTTLFLKKREKETRSKAKDVGVETSFIRFFGVMQVFPTLVCLPSPGGVLAEF